MSEEPILRENPNRYTLFPIKYPDLWALYKRGEASFWTAGEIDFTADNEDWAKLNGDEKNFILNILAFFAGSDGIVLENIMTRFFNEVQIPEARSFYALQAAVENIHGEVYSLLIDAFAEPDDKGKLFNAIQEIPCITKKAEWAIKWISDGPSFAHRLVAFAVVEGVFFSGSFCAIFWLKSRSRMVKTLGTSNELISRDESLHTEFAICLYKYIENKLTPEETVKIVTEAVEIEKEFIIESLPCALIGMNSELMVTYIHFVADRLLIQLHCPPVYNVKNPFPFMNTIGLDGKSNFFEKRVTEYQLASTTGNSTGFDVTDDF